MPARKSEKELALRSSAAEYLTFVAATGESDISFEMRYEDENIWLTQKMMATLYDVSVAAINQHLKKVFEDGQLRKESVIKKYLITAADGKSYNTKHYNLQAIIAVGFKVNNQRAVQFRKWAAQIVKSLFENAQSSSDLLLRLSAVANAPLIPGKTLVFLDEVQECKEIVTAIKFLVEEGSYQYIPSGSLLGVEMKDVRFVPVGYMDVLEMYPLDFEEFAYANKVSPKIIDALCKSFQDKTPVDIVIHEKMMELFRLYLIVGGMPAAVMRYLETNNLQEVLRIQRSIVTLYKRDIARYDPEHLYNLADDAARNEIIDSRAFSQFCGVDSSNQVPDGGTIGRFRHILERNQLGEAFFTNVVESLQKCNLMLKKGTIVDSTLIAAPSSTKDKEKQRDLKDHSVKIIMPSGQHKG